MAVRIEHHAEPLPGYRLIERLGGGGFGEVWKCEAPGGLHKAVKFVFGDLKAAGDRGHRAELLEEPPGEGSEAGAQAPADRRLFPNGCRDLREAVDRFLEGFGPEVLPELDGRVQ